MKTIRLIAMLVLVLVLGTVIIQNRAPVETHFLFITVTMPHILLLLLSIGGGFALGLLVAVFTGAKTAKTKSDNNAL
jgi:uncharacterized integral membrane protein